MGKGHFAAQKATVSLGGATAGGFQAAKNPDMGHSNSHSLLRTSKSDFKSWNHLLQQATLLRILMSTTGSSIQPASFVEPKRVAKLSGSPVNESVVAFARTQLTEDRWLRSTFDLPVQEWLTAFRSFSPGWAGVKRKKPGPAAEKKTARRGFLFDQNSWWFVLRHKLCCNVCNPI